MCFGGKAYQYWILAFGLALLPWLAHQSGWRFGIEMAVRHRDVVLAHLKELGLRINVRKVCFFSTENHISGHGGDPTTMQGRISPALIESILMSVKRVREDRLLTVSSFRNCWVWCQLHPTWYLLACCTWDPYSGGAKPRDSPEGKTHFVWSKSRGDAYVP